MVSRHPRVEDEEVHIGRGAELHRGAELYTAPEKIERLEPRPSGDAVLVVDLDAQGRQIWERLLDLDIDENAPVFGDGTHLNGAEDAQPIEALGVLPHFLRCVRLTDARGELAIDHVLLGMFQAHDPDLVHELALRDHRPGRGERIGSYRKDSPRS